MKLRGCQPLVMPYIALRRIGVTGVGCRSFWASLTHPAVDEDWQELSCDGGHVVLEFIGDDFADASHLAKFDLLQRS